MAWPTIGITRYKIAAQKAPVPSISEDIVIKADLLPFTYGYSDKSIDTALQQIVYGPPKHIPIKNITV